MKKLLGVMIAIVAMLAVGVGMYIHFGDGGTTYTSMSYDYSASETGSRRGSGLDPYDTVESALDALIDGDMDTFNDLVYYSGNYSYGYQSGDLDGEDFGDMMRDLDYTLIHSWDDGDDAYVTLLLNSEIDWEDEWLGDLDRDSVIGGFVAGIVEGVVDGVVGALTPGDEEISLHLEKQRGEWKLEVDDAFVSVIVGGALASVFN